MRGTGVRIERVHWLGWRLPGGTPLMEVFWFTSLLMQIPCRGLDTLENAHFAKENAT